MLREIYHCLLGCSYRWNIYSNNVTRWLVKSVCSLKIIYETQSTTSFLKHFRNRSVNQMRGAWYVNCSKLFLYYHNRDTDYYFLLIQCYTRKCNMEFGESFFSYINTLGTAYASLHINLCNCFFHCCFIQEFILSISLSVFLKNVISICWIVNDH